MSKEVVCSTKDMPREEWLRIRQSGIGGSDAAKVVNHSRWGGALTVYVSKTKPLDEVEVTEISEAAYFGTMLEDFVAQEFSRRSGLKVYQPFEMYRSVEHPFMLADVDRCIEGKNIGLECKTASAYKANEWEENNVPDEYFVQVQHYCTVMGWEGCWIACLIGGQSFVYKYIPRNDEFIRQMVILEEAFWEQVKNRVPPAATVFDGNVVNAVQEGEEETWLEPTQEDVALVRELRYAQQDLKNRTARVDELETMLKDRIGKATGIEGLVSWKTVQRKPKVDWEGIASKFVIDDQTIKSYTKQSKPYRRLNVFASENDLALVS